MPRDVPASSWRGSPQPAGFSGQALLEGVAGLKPEPGIPGLGGFSGAEADQAGDELHKPAVTSAAHMSWSYNRLHPPVTGKKKK